MFSRVTATFYVHLAPKFVGAPMRGVEDHLNRMLLKYNDQVGGVVLSYRNVQFLSDTAAILYDSPFMHFHISAELLAFAPTAGARLTGVINKQSPSHIGLLVYNLFNASIPAAQLPDGAFTFQFDDSAAYAPTGEDEAEGDDGSAPRFNKGGKKAMINGNWIHSASGSVLEPGHALDFIATEVVKSHDFISMKGTLVGVEYVPPPPTTVPTTPAAAAAPNSQRITFGDDDDDEEAMDMEPAAAAVPKKSKKSKKAADGEGDDASGDADRKKRKRKLSQSAAKEEPADDAAAQQPVEAAPAPASVVAGAAGKKDKKKHSKATNDGEKSSKKRKKE
ncbi:hypothetical protein AMAG_11574 [Allomyces macrogynus ATCC 38327]|uniref:RPA43 OB domain-containing protein n=1 Tax=Allomyces macrogynus (strain ATCC 38327) TaxID=578462 RepID=A0A0L0SVD6_ALLM3|nr:hypothetical protein AMAG_11574 [Allomyces macrogynus ATCC 38327]|eukprot:KNE66436.1 hypothetical protein AMAG_11574 [Allomyces macrogynus ATCC 38327]